MPPERERKIPSNVSFTARQTEIVRREAKRLGISFADQLRRIIDEWAEKRPGLASKLYEGR